MMALEKDPIHGFVLLGCNPGLDQPQMSHLCVRGSDIERPETR